MSKCRACTKHFITNSSDKKTFIATLLGFCSDNCYCVYLDHAEGLYEEIIETEAEEAKRIHDDYASHYGLYPK
jgi:hypothetical protein